MNTDWRTYPFRLVADDPALDFPAAEGVHDDQESDTWFIAGELTGATGRTFAFLTIFNKNRPGGTVVADFYTMALFDCDTGEYGTYTDFDMPPKNMQPDARPKMTMAAGYCDIRYDSSAGPVAWTACRDTDGELLPYTYRVSLRGIDQAGQTMELDLEVTPTRAPVPVGADSYGGAITCFGQPDTYSYFQTGMKMGGTLRWGEQRDEVTGSAGHVDRQWFPKYAGGGGTGGDPRCRSHEWRTINLDNGVDMSIWHQFDRMNGNALQPFSGATVSYPDPAVAPECAEDVEIVTSSYVRWPNSIRPLVRPPALDRFMPDLHHLRSAALELDLVGEPLVPAPAHGLPIEYMEGPYRYHGTMRGESVTGFAIYERSLAMYRDWELVDVLAVASGDHELAGRIRSLLAAGSRSEARKLLRDNITGMDDNSRDVAEALHELLAKED